MLSLLPISIPVPLACSVLLCWWSLFSLQNVRSHTSQFVGNDFARWFLKRASRSKLELHRRHVNIWECSSFLCWFSCSRTQNVRLHTSHVNTSECSSFLCCFSFSWPQNVRLHTSQFFRCFSKRLCRRKCWLHCGHENGPGWSSMSPDKINSSNKNT